MNRKHRRSLILLPLSLGVVGVFAGREMASWRPVELARFDLGGKSALVDLSASQHLVAQSVYTWNNAAETRVTLLNLVSGKAQTFSLPGQQTVGVQNGFFWHSRTPGGDDLPLALEVMDENGHKKTFTYRTPPDDNLNNETVRILPKQDRVVILDLSGLSEWSFRSERLRRAIPCAMASARALSRDGRTFVMADYQRFKIGDVATGKITRVVPVRGIQLFEYVHLSPYGRYALFDQSNPWGSWKVADTATGKYLWTLYASSMNPDSWVITDDERTIFMRKGRQWEVHDLQTGATLRQLPLVAGVTVAASSPDGATLYSVAKGVLYRQRAR